MSQSVPNIQMIAVLGSENIAAYGYEPQTRILAVQFRKTGATYHVADFDPADWAAFQAAESKGGFYYAQVRRRYSNITKA